MEKMGRRGKTTRPGLPHTARRNRREIWRSLRYTEKEQEDYTSTTTEEMAENQENPLPPAIAADQMDLETLYDAWERYKDLLRRCPHHGLPLWLQVQTFYNGVNPSTRQMIDATASGTINNKTPEGAYKFIEEMSLNNYQCQVMRTKPTKIAGVYNIDAVNMLPNHVKLLNKKIDGLLGSAQVHPVMRCDSSGGGIHTEYQPFNPTTEEEQVHYMGTNNSRPQNNPYSNTYNTALLQMPNAMKFLKELLATKRKLDEASHVELNAVCTAILQNKLPNKLKDSGSFTIPCLIGSLDVNNALANLRASINVMPYKIFKQLGLGKPKQTWMSIQLADKTIRFPRGIIEDVLVKIDKFIFPVDFVVLDIEEDSNTPLILGRPFLATARKIIDVGIGELTLREISLKDIHEPCSSNNKGPIHEERRLQIKELDGWWTHKSRTHDKPKLRQDELNTLPNQLKVRDKVLLDATDPRITTVELNEENPLIVLNIFPYGTVEVNHSKFGSFKVNITRLKPYFDETDSRNEECKLLEPP
ncbi:hypothetical protein CXB51_027988 [Gossypium anomalum]|uniref:Retrotransposon gag domain-containing protein n=1 Tax=Gossypium anomalum TaxID=47600 RepID=A0A8J5YY48_9ROSI|nr:hypothetical protein CXB51_027988 [Gossypium anomalum]